MSYFETSNPRYAPVRRFETTDWNHADVFNASVGQIVQNVESIRSSRILIKRIKILPSDWKNKSYKIENAEIAADSICDVYWSNESKEAVLDAEIEGETVQGALQLKCETVPSSSILIDCIEVRNEVIADAG